MIFHKPIKPKLEIIWNIENPLSPNLTSKVKVKPEPEDFCTRPITNNQNLHFISGRTSRLLMNWILMQNGFPPVIIRKQDRLLYYQHLVTANDGDIRPFVRFIAKCTSRTLDAYIWSTKQNSLAPFGDESNTISLKENLDHLDYHDAVILGGSLDGNITIEP